MSQEQVQVVRASIAATFTSEPLEESLRFWARRLEEPWEISFAPYNQVFQELLDPASAFHAGSDGINVVLVRFEDWLREGRELSAGARRELLERNARDLVLALRSSAARSPRPHLVFCCPPSPGASADAELGALLRGVEDLVASELGGEASVHLFRAEEVLAAHPAGDYHDPRGDEVGHIPFTRAFYAALGTLIARKTHALRHPPYKVVVVDCDWTLWRGVCAEDGLAGIQITPAYRALQAFLLAQQRAGVLLCLCSKNREEDVLEVLDRHPDMLLRREHVVAHRINWRPKSENIASLARELDLGLDSFVFLDDNPLECAEVRAGCPSVLVIEVPPQAEGAAGLLERTWAFDRLRVTGEDRARTELYRQTLERASARRDFMTVGDFLKSLDLRVDVRPIVEDDLARAAQLTQRTNQFNATARRRAEGELRAMGAEEGAACLVVEARDRFGDYGMIGVLAARAEVDALLVDTFLMSCRVLGRGVEHQMLAELGRLARARGLGAVRVPFVPTKRNQPMREFLDSVAGAGAARPAEQACVYELPAEHAAAVTYEPQVSAVDPWSAAAGGGDAPATSQVRPRVGERRTNELLAKLAAEITDVAQILRAIDASARRCRPDTRRYVAPQTATEQTVADIWAQILVIDRVGSEDDFFELGGTSMHGAALLSQVREAFGVELALLDLFDARTVAAYARRVSLAQIELASKDDISALLEEIGALSEAEVAALLAAG